MEIDRHKFGKRNQEVKESKYRQILYEFWCSKKEGKVIVWGGGRIKERFL